MLTEGELLRELTEGELLRLLVLLVLREDVLVLREEVEGVVTDDLPPREVVVTEERDVVVVPGVAAREVTLPPRLPLTETGAFSRPEREDTSPRVATELRPPLRVVIGEPMRPPRGLVVVR